MWKKIGNWIASIPPILVSAGLLGASAVMFGIGTGFVLFGFSTAGYVFGVIALALIALALVIV